MFLLYSFLFSLGVVLTAPYYLWRTQGNIAPGADWRERFGILPDSFEQATRGAVWVHAVSVGETLAVVGLIQALQQLFPEKKVFLSHVTAAGREAGIQRLPSVAGRFYLPLDWDGAVRPVYERVRPALLLIVETELWPNLVRVAREFGSKVILVNARLSDRSFRRYRLFRPFMRRVLENVEWVGAQTARDAERFKLLGMKPERVSVTGNMKFDGKPPHRSAITEHLKKALVDNRRSPVMAAISTMPGEEEAVLEAWTRVRSRHPQALLVLAPRHPARFESVAQLLTRQRQSFIRRTALATDDTEVVHQLSYPEVFLLDTIGELSGILDLADLVFVGGSLVRTGGHNLLEPAFWGKPILFGPHMENFRDAADLLLKAGGAIEVRDGQALAQKALDLIENSERRRQLGKAARQILDQEAGATGRTLEKVKELLETGIPSQTGRG